MLPTALSPAIIVESVQGRVLRKWIQRRIHRLWKKTKISQKYLDKFLAYMGYHTSAILSGELYN
jgi:hypothetical protein